MRSWPRCRGSLRRALECFTKENTWRRSTRSAHGSTLIASLLLSAFEQNSGILVLVVKKFGDVEDEHTQLARDDGVLGRAKNLMEPVVNMYAEGMLNAEGFANEQRGRMLLDASWPVHVCKQLCW